MSKELCRLNIKEAHKGLMNKEFSSLELTKAFLERIGKEDKKISSFLTVSEDLALSQAKKADKLISRKSKISFLTGLPLAVKDNILVEGVRTTCASKILEDYIAPYDAACVKKLKELGGVILGKTNLDEFAMGSSTENSAFFATKNPFDLKRTPGGSSGGSAAAVADDLAIYALGSDTGGSVRQPASFCGVVGLKPTYGAVSRRGLVAFASSLDQIGPITKTTEDAAIVFEAIAGRDFLDSTSFEFKKTKAEFKISDIKAGAPKEYFVKGIDAAVEKIIKESIRKLEKLGVKIEEISLPRAKYAVAVYQLINTSEASANLARYDGVKYGFSKAERGKGLLSLYLKSRGEGFGDEVKRRIMLGAYALSAGYYEAYYLKAQKVRTLIKNDFEEAFKKVDIILAPVAPTLPFKLGEKISDPLSMYLEDIFTAPANLAGLPAVSVPAGLVGSLPVGLQIIGRPFEENKILAVGENFSLR